MVAGSRSRAQHNSSGLSPRGQLSAVSLVRLILLIGDGVPAIYLPVNERIPALGQMPGQFIAHCWHIHRNGTGHDQQSGITAHPQFMDDRCHQTQDTTGPLESLQRGPILVQTVKHLRVDGVTGDHPITVFDLTGLHREVTLVFVIHLTELRADRIAGLRVFAVQEEPPAHDLKALVCRYWFPDRLHTSKGMLNGFQGNFSRIAADFDIGLRDRGHHKTVLAGPRRFGHLLDERDEVVKGSGRQSVCAIQFLCIGHQLVHQHQTGTAGVKQVLQRLRARRNALLISLFYIIVELRIAC